MPAPQRFVPQVTSLLASLYAGESTHDRTAVSSDRIVAFMGHLPTGREFAGAGESLAQRAEPTQHLSAGPRELASSRGPLTDPKDRLHLVQNFNFTPGRSLATAASPGFAERR